MYKIIYEKENGDIIERVRNTKPITGIGERTSMGWLIKDILFKYDNKYYVYSDYCKLTSKARKKFKTQKMIKNLMKKYKDIAIIIITFYVAKFII